MPHLTATDAPTFSVHGVTFTSLVSSATGSHTLAAWRADFAPRTPGEAHTMSDEEVLHLLDGTLAFEVGEERFTAHAGEAVLVPAGAVFRVTNASDQPASAWVTTTLGMTATMIDSGERMTPPWAQ